MKHWAFKYIGIPYKLAAASWEGVDCYGLVRLIYQNEKGIQLPELPGIIGATLPEATKVFLSKNCDKWIEVEKPKEGDGVAMSQKTVIHHFGIWTEANGGRVLHAWKKDGSVVADTLKMLRLRGYRTIRFYTYATHH